ncbi:DUF914-domain-containing protein [Dacryopinax primogenitus]|uniref:DUF914-domain-containing protein n=1 Tax=Dacryopinax primogenitus (strain DJM 731) TaxID=1858805 RepID=M5G632_DACPD|nr:DUF914-domain-containing protein [Dacryopinax primogenitus]EJU03675.1 DUF914-domain-containing protein [Dacryopinax primogenitus]
MSNVGQQYINAPAIPELRDGGELLSPVDEEYGKAQLETDGEQASGEVDKDSVPVGVAVIPSRPSIVYTSFSAYFQSVRVRFKGLWTRRFVLSLLAGQLVSLCITCTSVCTTELGLRGWALPTTQTFFLYFILFLIYTPYTVYRYGFKGWATMILKDGYKYIFLAACDVEGNYTVVLAYEYTTLLSCMLLDAWAIPVCIGLSWLYMRTRLHWSQYVGVLVCIAGLGLLVTSDEITDKDWQSSDMVRGDILMIIGATLYGVSNATEELFVRNRPLYEVVGQMGFWGVIINGCQAAGLEHKLMTEVTWNGPVIGLLFAYTAAMLILYTVAPLLYRMTSAAYYNLSLLTSDFYGLLFGLFLYHYAPFWLYFPAFAVVILGLIIYYWHQKPEDQAKVNIRTPDYVTLRGFGVNNTVEAV